MNGSKLSNILYSKKVTGVLLAVLLLLGLVIFLGMPHTTDAPVVSNDSGTVLNSIKNVPEGTLSVESPEGEADMTVLEEQIEDSAAGNVAVETVESVPEAVATPPVYALETITLAGGCFWCIEGALQDVLGVIDAVSGYSGGDAKTANYLDVSKGRTEHREVVQVTYDANVISTEEVLNNFWSAIDPTDAGGQFADRGPHYTTAIYYHTDEQRKTAEASKANLNTSGLVDGAVVTEVLPFTAFYQAEEYHQDYYLKSSAHYKRYEKASGRAGFVEDTWARDAAQAYFEAQASGAE